MHIVHVGLGFKRQTLDGATRAVSGYVPHLVELGHEVTMVRFSPGEAYGSNAVDNGLTEVTLPVPRLSLALGPRAVDFFRHGVAGADFYHFHLSYARHSLAAQLVDAPYAVSPHGAYLPANMRRRGLWNRAFRLVYGARYLRRASFLHAITDFEQAALEQYTSVRRVETIPNCLQLPASFDIAQRRAERARLGLSDTDLLVLFLGRLDVYGKGLDVLLRGFAEAHARAPERRLRLMLVGPPDGPDVRPHVAPQIADSVSICAPVYGEEKRALLAAADVFATISRWDVMPTAALDALGAGLPLLISEQTGFDAHVRRHDAGRVVPHDAHKVAEAICGFDPLALLESREARIQAALDEFHPRQIAQRFVALYEDAAKERSGAPV